VAPVSGSTASPQEEQNLPVAEIFAPHFAQNMGIENLTIGPRPAVSADSSS